MAATDSATINGSDYQELVGRIRERVRSVVPPAATIAVVSRGDEELTAFDSHHGWHFPRNLDGRYAGYHPADSTAAISHLEYLRRQGAGYFILPSPSFWWLDYYEDFRAHLDSRYRMLSRDDDCLIFQLVEDDGHYADTTIGAAEDPLHHPLRETTMIAELLDNLLPDGASTALLSAPDQPQVTPPSCSPWHVTGATAADRGTFDDAVDELIRHRVRFLVVPRAAFEWLGRHPAAGESLRSQRLVTSQAHACEIYELSASAESEPVVSDASGDEAGRKSESIWRRIFSSLFGRNGR